MAGAVEAGESAGVATVAVLLHFGLRAEQCEVGMEGWMHSCACDGAEYLRKISTDYISFSRLMSCSVVEEGGSACVCVGGKVRWRGGLPS